MRTHLQCGPERDLLLALLRWRRDAQDSAELLPLLHKVNWEHFLTIICQDLYPYLAFCLEPYVGIVAPGVWEQLIKARRITAIHNLRQRHELLKAVEALRVEGIPTLALKGVVLAYVSYPDPSLRPMSDVDVLVPPGRREQAVVVLRKAGFDYPNSAVATHRDHVLRLAPGQEFAPPLRLRASTVLLEVHSQLECSEPVLPMPAQEFWSRSTAVDLNGLKVGTLCPEDFLFHLCLHQSRHHRFEKGLLPLVDLRMLLDSHQNWNWASIAARSVQCGCTTSMYITLEVARDLAGAPVPDSFFQALPPPDDLSRLRCLVEEQIWSAQSGTPVPFLPSLLAELSWRRRYRMLFNRMRLVRREELSPELTFASLVQRVQLSHQRLFATFKTIISRYFHARKSGHMKFRAIWRKSRLLRQSNTLFQMLEQRANYVDNQGPGGHK